jgi:hypothetical protein
MLALAEAAHSAPLWFGKSQSHVFIDQPLELAGEGKTVLIA